MNTSQISGIIRNILSTLGGAVGYDGLTKDAVTGEQNIAQLVVGAALVLVGIGHSYFVNRTPAKKE